VRDDLKKCDLLDDRREVAGETTAWRGVVKLASEDLNHQLEASERRRISRKVYRKLEYNLAHPALCVMNHNVHLSH
jgi:hypothetical protein